MTDFTAVPGFEDVWRPPVRTNRRRPETVLGSSARHDPRARLARLAARAPEVMVKVTGRTRTPTHLKAHLNYITRHGALELIDQDGNRLLGQSDVRELGDDWSDLALADRRRRPNSPFSHSVMLSMPAGTDALIVRDAAVAFAAEVFGGRFDYVLALHTDTPRPHIHLSVCSLGDVGTRLNPKKADLEVWRQVFAEQLRLRGVSAEATPRRARGVTRKAERTPVRKLRDRYEAGLGSLPKVRRAAYRDAARAAFSADAARRPWEVQLLATQVRVRRLYLQQARVLRASADPADRALADRVVAFVEAMPPPDSHRLSLARDLRAANRNLSRDSEAGSDRSRSR